MMRFIFRAWHKDAQMMLFEDNYGDCLKWHTDGQPIEIMQWTGTKDKNGVGIFESDIIQSRNGERKYVVKWDEKEANFYGEMIGRVDNNFIAWNRFEVIGNIYQNDELMDKGPKGDESTETA